jgi:sialidase-1
MRGALQLSFALALARAALQDVFKSGVGGYACYRIPALVADAGTLYAFAEGRRFSCADHGWNDIVLSRSTDGGATWSAPAVVYGESNATHFVTIGNPAPVLLAPGGSLLLPFSRNNLQVGFLRSADGGAHWGAPQPLPAAVLPAGLTWVATGPPGSLRLPSGRLVVPVDAQAAGLPYSSGALLSDDGGATWRLSSLVRGGNEAQAVGLPWKAAGAVHLSMRSAGGAARRGAESADGGATWGAPWGTIAETECEGSVVALPAAPGGPRLVMSSAFSSKRENLTLHVSADDGRTWAPRVRVYAGGAAYSSLASLDGERLVGLLFEADGYARICYTNVSVA